MQNAHRNPRPAPEFQQIHDLAAGATTYAALNGMACIELPGHPELGAIAVDSAEFRAWLADGFAERNGEYPKSWNLRYGQFCIGSHARCHTAGKRRIERRFAVTGQRPIPEVVIPEKLYYDLADPAGDVVEITPDGWRIGNEAPVTFFRGRHSRALPRPAHPRDPSATLGRLREALGIRGDADFLRLLGWLATVMLPTGVCPVLVLHGPRKAGKGAAARLLKELTDPADLLSVPPAVTERQLREAAWLSRVFVIEGVTRISERLDAILAGIAVGTGHDHRERFSPEAYGFFLRRPTIVTLHRDTSGLPFAKHVFYRYSLPIEIEPAASRSAPALSRQDHADLLGLLCDAAVLALAGYREVPRANLPRCRDAALWAMAGAPALGVAPDAMREAFFPPTEAELTVRAVADVLANSDTWTGTMSELRATLPPELRQASAKRLSDVLQSAHVEAHARGLSFEKRRSNGRNLFTITRAGSVAAASYPATEPAAPPQLIEKQRRTAA